MNNVFHARFFLYIAVFRLFQSYLKYSQIKTLCIPTIIFQLAYTKNQIKNFLITEILGSVIFNNIFCESHVVDILLLFFYTRIFKKGFN